jgi:hypothetical protein
MSVLALGLAIVLLLAVVKAMPPQTVVEQRHVFVRFFPSTPDYTNPAEASVLGNSTARPGNFYFLFDSSSNSRASFHKYWKNNGALLQSNIIEPIQQKSKIPIRFGLGSFTTKRLAGLGWADDYPFEHVFDLSSDIAGLCAQFATNVTRSTFTSASNYSSSTEALMQVILGLSAGKFGANPAEDAETHVFLATDRTFGTPGVFSSRWLAPLTEFLNSNNWAINQTALAPNNLNDVMEDNCTLYGMACPDVCTLNLNFALPGAPVVCEACALQLATISKLNATQFAAGSCEDFPPTPAVATLGAIRGVVLHVVSGLAALNSSPYTQLHGLTTSYNGAGGEGYFWPNGTNLTQVLPPLVGARPIAYTNVSVSAGLTSLVRVDVVQVDPDDLEVNVTLTFAYNATQVPGQYFVNVGNGLVITVDIRLDSGDYAGGGIHDYGFAFPAAPEAQTKSQSDSKSSSKSRSQSWSLSESRSSSQSLSSTESISSSQSRSSSESRSSSKSRSQSWSLSESRSSSQSLSSTESRSSSQSWSSSESRSSSYSRSPVQSSSPSESKSMSQEPYISSTPNAGLIAGLVVGMVVVGVVLIAIGWYFVQLENAPSEGYMPLDTIGTASSSGFENNTRQRTTTRYA